MISFESSYYEKEIVLDSEMQQVLFDAYVKLASKYNFNPEVSNYEEICCGDVYDHVAYHVELYKNEVLDFNIISELFI